MDTLLALSLVLEADQTRELERRGLTASKTHLLWVVHHRGPATQAQLAEALQVTPRHVTTLVDALEATGFARRTPHPTDRRAVLVDLTDRGRSVMTAMTAEHESLGAELVRGLDAESVAVAADVLDHVLQRLQTLVAEHEARQAERAETS